MPVHEMKPRQSAPGCMYLQSGVIPINGFEAKTFPMRSATHQTETLFPECNSKGFVVLHCSEKYGSLPEVDIGVVEDINLDVQIVKGLWGQHLQTGEDDHTLSLPLH